MSQIVKLSLIFLLFPLLLLGQQNLIRNGSFNGENVNYTYPEFWHVCPNNTNYVWNDPNCIERDGNTRPVHGKTFMRLRAHGRNYTESVSSLNFKETREFITQQLENPLEKNTLYMFSVFLCFNSTENFPDKFEPNIAYPMKLNLLVSNDSCNQDKLLMETPVVRNTNWKIDTFTFNTFDQPFQYLTLQIQWDTLTVKNYPYNGMMLLDSARLEKICTMNSSRETVDFLGDGLTQLTAPVGDAYEWFPKGNVSESNTQMPVITSYADSFYVLVKHNGNPCPDLKVYTMKVDCDKLFPIKTTDTVDVSYRKDQKVYLAAKEGKAFDWSPAEFVSNATIQAPFLLSYSEQVTVSITDKYGCVSSEIFNIKIDCNLLNPESQKVALDTLVKHNASVVLKPTYGTLDGNWSPNTDMNCTNCQNPIVTPNIKTVYNVSLKDEFECIHNELFIINVDFDIPNFVTPNGDLINDNFIIAGLPENTTIQIFDKSGTLVYSSSAYDNSWNGIDKDGKLVESGTYWFFVQNKKAGIEKKGFVFLKR